MTEKKNATTHHEQGHSTKLTIKKNQLPWKNLWKQSFNFNYHIPNSASHQHPKKIQPPPLPLCQSVDFFHNFYRLFNVDAIPDVDRIFYKFTYVFVFYLCIENRVAFSLNQNAVRKIYAIPDQLIPILNFGNRGCNRYINPFRASE